MRGDQSAKIPSIMKIAYFDCIGGVSGDMILGALVDSGLSLETLNQKFRKLPIAGWDVVAKKVVKNGIAASSVEIVIKKQTELRKLEIIEALLKKSSLSKEEIEDSIKIFHRMGKVEANVHGTSMKNVHFHEIGAIDTIIDIVGAVCGLRLLGIKKVMVSPFPIGKAGPATLELLKGFLVFGIEEQEETVTPTGAAILTTLASSVIARSPESVEGRRGNLTWIPSCTIQSVGYGAGKSDFQNRPNVLRLIIGEQLEVYETSSKFGARNEALMLLETNIDDVNPQVYDYVMERMFKGGALDVWFTPIQMKKNRPAVTLSILCDIADDKKLSGIVFEEGLTLGIRRQLIDRTSLPRDIRTVKTKYGDIRVKIAKYKGKIVRAVPEYDDCKEIAKREKISIHTIIDSAREQFSIKKLSE